jgi:hypothetical protein
MTAQRPNRLINESSPYLLQHARNPVDWHPWGEEAFALARSEDKPVFLSIGYSTCHWCHVMAHESFEDEAVAALLNEAFINVKVDREDRPDIDSIYMAACQMLTGSGGWPLTIVMTPDGRPFFAATYIPRLSRGGRTGMLELVPRIRDIWRKQRADVTASADSVAEHMRRHAEGLLRPSGGGAPDDTTVRQAVDTLCQRYDARHGGFGSAPKFPAPHSLLLLLRHAHRTQDAARRAQLTGMVSHTLEAMRLGGIFDHAGYGFHRYSTDKEWLLPHFEKMLYDQAMHVLAYTRGWQLTGRPLFRRTAEEIMMYVMRDLTSPQGAFYAAEDADSDAPPHFAAMGLPPGGEGFFYLFTLQEIRGLLSREDALLAEKIWNLQEEGNYHDESTGRKTGLNILHLPAPLSALAGQLGMEKHTLTQLVDEIRATLIQARSRRPRPHLDDKVLTDWNGLMITAMATAGMAFDAPHYTECAARAADFILSAMRDSNGRLLHRWRNGKASVTACLDDYAFFIAGLTALYEATHEVRWLREAAALQQVQDTLHRDGTSGVYYLTAADAPDLLMRPVEAYDAACPSGNSVTLLNLARLARLTGNQEHEQSARRLLEGLSTQVRHMPGGYTMLLCGVDFLSGGGRTVVVSGEQDSPDTEALLTTVASAYSPDTCLLLRTPMNAGQLAQAAPFTRHLTHKGRTACAYVCENYTCSQPVTDPRELLEHIVKPAGGSLD